MRRESLRVLMTNWVLNRTGSALFVKDFALQLLSRGHQPTVYCPFPGEVGDELQAAGVAVVNDIDQLETAPDLIHGHHHIETMTALLRFPGVPAISFCHGPLAGAEAPPKFPRIVLYVAVSRAAHNRLVVDNRIPQRQTRILLSGVDLGRFRPRPPLPGVPRRALMFGHYFSEGDGLGVLREACARRDLELELAGIGAGRLRRDPENILGDYDIVFAKGRCALEAMAVGAAVILCDVEGGGPLVSSANLDRVRAENFGAATLTEPLDVESLVRQIDLYDASDAAAVSRRLRDTAGLDQAADKLVEIYREALDAYQDMPPADPALDQIAAARYLQRWNATFYGRHIQSIDWKEQPLLEATAGLLDSTERRFHEQRRAADRWRTELASVYDSMSWRFARRILRLPGIRGLAEAAARRRSAGRRAAAVRSEH